MLHIPSGTTARPSAPAPWAFIAIIALFSGSLTATSGEHTSNCRLEGSYRERIGLNDWRIVTGPVTPDRAVALWGLFKREYSKVYRSASEEEGRRAVFTHNIELISASNAVEGRRFSLGINPYSDLTFAEYSSARLSGYHAISNDESASVGAMSHLSIKGGGPSAMDWREHGAVGPVQDQGDCGSCWAFASVACLEAHHFIKHKTLLKLSEQDLIDCGDTAFDLDRCYGGDAARAYKYIAYAGGLALESDVPYLCEKTQSDSCHNASCRDPHPPVHAPVTGSTALYGGEEEMEAVVGTKGPIVVAITANELFQHYAGGVFEDATCTPGSLLNHAVAVVGYGSSGDDGDYWIIKNSHGEGWGECGFIRFRKGVNMCSIAKRPVCPDI